MRGYETSATLHIAVIGLSLGQNGLELATTHLFPPRKAIRAALSQHGGALPGCPVVVPTARRQLTIDLAARARESSVLLISRRGIPYPWATTASARDSSCEAASSPMALPT